MRLRVLISLVWLLRRGREQNLTKRTLGSCLGGIWNSWPQAEQPSVPSVSSHLPPELVLSGAALLQGSAGRICLMAGCLDLAGMCTGSGEESQQLSVCGFDQALCWQVQCCLPLLKNWRANKANTSLKIAQCTSLGPSAYFTGPRIPGGPLPPISLCICRGTAQSGKASLCP